MSENSGNERKTGWLTDEVIWPGLESEFMRRRHDQTAEDRTSGFCGPFSIKIDGEDLLNSSHSPRRKKILDQLSEERVDELAELGVDRVEAKLLVDAERVYVLCSKFYLGDEYLISSRLDDMTRSIEKGSARVNGVCVRKMGYSSDK